MNKETKSWVREGTTAMLFSSNGYEDGIAIRFDANTAIADSNISILKGDDSPIAIIEISDTSELWMEADDLWSVI